MRGDPVGKILLVGAGGHARVCAEALRDDPRNEIVGALSRDGHAVAGLEVPVIGRDTDLEDAALSVRANTVCVAIGDNQRRQQISERVAAYGLPLATALSRFAMISRRADVGAGSVVLPGAVINAVATVGTGAIVNTAASVDHDCIIGDFAHLAPGSTLGGNVIIETGALVGLGATVLPGVTVGAWAVIGAGAVVLRNVGSGDTVVGNPARVIRRAEIGGNR